MQALANITTVAYGEQAGQEGDLWLAGAAQAPFAPVVVLLHGGFWRMPWGREQLDGVAQDLAVRGFAVWNVGYRRLGQPGGGWPGTFEDVAAAVDHLTVLASHGAPLDLSRVVVAGHSAGGQLALWAVARRRAASSRGPRRVLPAAAVGLAPVADLRTAAEQRLGHGAVADLVGGSPAEVPARYAAVSPRDLLPLGAPQLLLHGVRDAAVPVAASRAYVAAAREAGDEVSWVELPDSEHMDFVRVESAAHAAFRRWLLRWAESVVTTAKG
ncbi:MAG: alpha/beta hydrolase [Holophagales bacterium]|nr:MAG: alpha/beta hydrolase [Holophagales bacterium]